ncbi:MAG TPA: L,D-transpeptidase [Actinomycetota bacterium]|nr:L,D-transpeptidase [Actinomycetota bacterium]
MSDEERKDEEPTPQEPSAQAQPAEESGDDTALFSSSSEPRKEDPTASKWAFGKGQGSRLRPRLKLPGLPSLSGIRLPKLPERLRKVPESWPKLPGNTASWVVGAALFVVVLLIYGLIANLTGGGAPAAQRRATPRPGAGVSPSPSPAEELRACERPSLIATVAGEKVAARKEPHASARVIKSFGRKSVLGAPQVFLIQEALTGPAGDAWLKVLLPVRPNGTTGYVPALDVDVSKTMYRLKVIRNKFQVNFYEGCELVDRFKVGIGTGDTPTPVGNFYLQALYKLPNPNTVYGTYAYALSGYSDVITDWKYGGIIGLHGTNDPKGSIGRYVSHGCIRMRNVDIESLVPRLPLGTPIEIT